MTEPASDFKEFTLRIGQKIMKIYWGPMYHYLKEHSELIQTFTGFLLSFEKVVFYYGKTHLALEYYGPERIEELKSKGRGEFEYHDFTSCDENFLELIIGFKYRGSLSIEFPLPPFLQDLVLPTNAGLDKLLELKWNFDAQETIVGMNTSNLVVPDNQFTRIVNGLFFDADEGGLKTRHIKWMDFFPLRYDDSAADKDSLSLSLSMLKNRVEADAKYVYPIPVDFKYAKLVQINRFIELIGNSSTREPQITGFLARDENKFILKMGFSAISVVPQAECEWQGEERVSIKPDFFVVSPNGYADIAEFKLPTTKGSTVVGPPNRETFSAEINSYISQTRTYKTYFEDPRNREWVENKYGFKVYNPKRILVVGRRWQFSSVVWRKIISDFRDITIINYDDLVDGVTAQFYF